MECDLTKKNCKPCEGGVEAMSIDDANAMLENVDSWSLVKDNTAIQRKFSFKGFKKTMAFVNAIADMANVEQHHPDMEVGYNYCNVTYTTHAISGLSENDFICASKVDLLASS